MAQPWANHADWRCPLAHLGACNPIRPTVLSLAYPAAARVWSLVLRAHTCPLLLVLRHGGEVRWVGVGEKGLKSDLLNSLGGQREHSSAPPAGVGFLNFWYQLKGGTLGFFFPFEQNIKRWREYESKRLKVRDYEKRVAKGECVYCFYNKRV